MSNVVVVWIQVDKDVKNDRTCRGRSKICFPRVVRRKGFVNLLLD